MKLKTLIAAFLFWIGSISVSAAPAGNPANLKLTVVDDRNFGLAFESTLVFERELERSNAELDEAQDFYTRFFYKLEEFPVELYVLAGLMRFEVEQGSRHFDTEYGFAYGFGARSEVWSNNDGTAVGLDLKYRRSEPDIDNSTFGPRQDATYQDWEIAVKVSQEMTDQVKPYAGIKYDDARISGVPGFAAQNGEHVIGLFGGAEFMMTDEVAFHVQANIISEYALTGSVLWRF